MQKQKYDSKLGTIYENIGVPLYFYGLVILQVNYKTNYIQHIWWIDCEKIQLKKNYLNKTQINTI